MDTLERSALVVAFVKQLREHGSWSGETHVQKACFFAQDAARVPLDFNFTLYRHGPFSFDLRLFLDDLRAESFLTVQPRPPYGPSLQLGSRSDLLLSELKPVVAEYEDDLSRVAEFLGDSGVARLERLATAYYFLSQKPRLSDAEVAALVHNEKPHISVDKATEATAEVREWAAEDLLVA